ncbi:MAG: eukaryotic-like serine/threonine-protein kinase [Frankiales bacterium]|nr:eukaryotic-like serine/threonine-protein kinase [Frankiales bacterium]
MEALQRHDPAFLAGARVLGRLGEGGMGIVYLAEAPGGEQVAVKVIRPEFANDAAFRARFAREVAAAQRVDGRCTARVLAADIMAAPPYLVTEFIDGPTLAQYVAASGLFDGAALHAVAAGLAEALTAIHAAGVIHRDLKPTNVLLTVAGPKVVDFGVASAPDATALTTAHSRLGSPGWMAPEQVAGSPVGAAADVFGWGLVIAYASSGQHPFGAGPAEALLYRVMNDQPRLETVPDPLRPLVGQALNKDPAARPTAGELLSVLLGGAVADPAAAVTVLLARTWRPAIPATRLLDEPRPAPPSRLPNRPGRKRRVARWATLAVVLLAAGAAGAAGLMWFLVHPAGSDTPQTAGFTSGPRTAGTAPSSNPARPAATPAAPTTSPVTQPTSPTSPPTSSAATVTPIRVASALLNTGVYADGPVGTPHYYVLLRRGTDNTLSGTLAFIAQNGTTGDLRTFTGSPEQAGAVTITYNDGTLDLINDLGKGESFELSGCLGYLTEAKTRPDCTFALHPRAETISPLTTTAVGYRTYTNPRFGFSTQIPASFTSRPSPDNGDGLSFTSPDRRATVTAYGSNNDLNNTVATLENQMAADLHTKGGNVTYRNNSTSIAAVSGTYPSPLGTMVFYQRSVLGSGSIDTVLWIYPVADKHADDPLLYKSVDAFHPGDLTQPH